MKLYTPKQVALVMDAKEDEYVMGLSDWQILQDIMEVYNSFEELKHQVSMRKREEKIAIRHSGLADIWDEGKMPKGTLRETFNGVINIFGDLGEEGHPAKKVLTERLLALLADEYGSTVRSVKPKYLAVRSAGFVKEDYGATVFPVHMMKR
jgi:hypothetical protein